MSLVRNEEDASRANRYGYTQHQPALPLYDENDVRETLKLIDTHPFGKTFSVGGDMKVEFRRTGHILGAASIDLAIGKIDPVRVVFSGVGGPVRPGPSPAAPLPRAAFFALSYAEAMSTSPVALTTP